MAHVYACRHGQNQDTVEGILNGHRDRPLTDLGRAQAAAVARHLTEEKVSFTSIFSSPLIRARDTAEEIALAQGLKVQTHPLLIERDYGVLSGKPDRDIAKYASDIIEGDRINYFVDGEGTEPFADVYHRAEMVLKEMDEKHRGERVLLICHGDIMMMLRAVKRKISWRKGLLLPYIDNMTMIDLELEPEKQAAQVALEAELVRATMKRM